ncbi:hypothetical protein SOVF_075810 [Spinacia oleracea]|uniref:Uncharacterized protein LOC110791675 n=1 Tax=Spinacia oleracea TaxID=3562 RepID=A0A9R0IN00_SPIOL|nr:uncharacterized protein LOC110791675 [Spinacia oleracea]XP_021852144.1 uncharacterized protein LOC110791675 [Spinacia oleracea]KNA17888.1 hypothetical protein SOVF_075810 [Spinacia oleracea]
MAINFASKEEGSFRITTNSEGWKYPKVPVDEVYNSTHNTMMNSEFLFGPSRWSKAKKLFRVFPSYYVKDFEKTIVLKANDQDVTLKLLKSRKKFPNNGYVHLGLVQIAIKPLVSDILGDPDPDPVIVCLRDARFLTLENSLLSVVESDLAQGPFYFNRCPGYTIPWKDREILTLNIMTGGVPLALTYRVVYKVSKDITLDLRKSILGETTYFQPMATTQTESTTKWDEVQFPESWDRV